MLQQLFISEAQGGFYFKAAPGNNAFITEVMLHYDASTEQPSLGSFFVGGSI